MNELEKLTESESRRNKANRAEGRELSAEQKEKQVEEAEKKMAAKERLEVTGKEIKTTQNQIKNIVANMSMVVKAVAAIRAQLGAPVGGSIPSVVQDQKTLSALKNKLAGLYSEIKDLKVALLAEELKAVKEEGPNASPDSQAQEAARRVNEVLNKIGLYNQAETS